MEEIFSSQSYLESSLAFCDLCFGLIDSQKELMFECKICPDFAACLGCIKQRTQRIFSHRFDHYFSPYKPRTNLHWSKRNLAITCNLCDEKNFFGKRYQCGQCSDYNVCSKCLSEVEHRHYPSEEHTFTYVPNSTRIYSNRCLLACRVVRILRYRNADPQDRDEITGWTSTEAETIYADDLNNYYSARKQASEILDDNNLDFIPSIIEHVKTALPLIFIENN